MKKLMITVLAAGMAAAAWADAHISYSGQLRAANGEPLTGKTTGNIEFRLYDVPTGSKVPLWARDIAVQIDANGCFAVELHDGAGSEVQGNKPTSKVSLDDVIANNANLYLGLTVKGSSGEINPRQKLLSTPRAVFAENVSLAKGNFTVTGLATLSGGIAAGDKNEAFTVSKDGNVLTKGTLNVGKQATFTQGATFKQGATFSEASTFTKGATFDQGATFNQAATFTNGLSVTGGTYGVMPIGTIVMWYGDAKNVPAGWAICDGKDGKTPDLRGRFIVGVNPGGNKREAYNFGATGGDERILLTVDQMPSHTHTIVREIRNKAGKGDYEREETPVIVRPSSTDCGNDDLKVWAYDGSSNMGPLVAKPTGKGDSHENRPPYYALYYIMRVQ